MSITIRDGISGESVVIERPLLSEHIKVGRVLWYSGTTSCGSWNCPAIITQVNESKRLFRVRSLDNMIEQDGWYEFSISKHSLQSRKAMCLAEPAEVRAYLEQQRLVLSRDIADKKAAVQSAEAKLAHFDAVLPTLNI